ncbi:zinc finger protein 597-like [Macrosteles quadrilineatus]|uniref:zinc finger protein 597-like n=1 Tax=Macrosteles quadrilineatus TaxID=74068 RepID=UPI0023E17C5F|nr:zinc finger protein 597-like [Macrosteles quadrilineatus]
MEKQVYLDDWSTDIEGSSNRGRTSQATQTTRTMTDQVYLDDWSLDIEDSEEMAATSKDKLTTEKTPAPVIKRYPEQYIRKHFGTSAKNNWKQILIGLNACSIQVIPEGASFKRFKQMTETNEEVYEIPVYEVPDPSIELQCPDCSKTFCNKTYLKIHREKSCRTKKEEKKKSNFFCNECKRNFTNGFTLRRHQEFAHSTTNKFPCPFCSKCFKRKDALQLHLKTDVCTKFSPSQ